MDFGLKDKVALITGAGSQVGYGKAIALTLAQEGCDIIAVDADLAAAKKTSAEVKALGRKSIALKADVTKKTEVDEAVKNALAEFKKIDILVNNVGTASPMKPFLESGEEDWDLDMKVNYKGTLMFTKAVLPQMVKQKGGRIINLSSTGASIGFDPASTYAAAKGAVLVFSKTLAGEVGPSGTSGLRTKGSLENSGINVNIIATEQSANKSSSPQDVGKAAAFFASEGARRISGQVISV